MRFAEWSAGRREADFSGDRMYEAISVFKFQSVYDIILNYQGVKELRVRISFSELISQG